MALVGIDLGTTNSLISIWKDGKPELLKNSMGNLMTPSVVSIDEDGSILIGEVAKQRRVSHPGRTAAEFKRSMGTANTYSLGEKSYLPEELSAFLLKKLITDAEEQLGEEITEAVISVPAYFDDNQREATKRAAKFAGIGVKRLVNEPSAAVLYHRWKKDETEKEGMYLVIDFGGGTLDVSVVDCFENIIEIIAVSGDNRLGGKDFDRLIAVDFCQKNGLEFDELGKLEKENILWTAEAVKKTLTEKEPVKMHVVIDNKEYEAEYDNDELLKVTAELLVKIKKVLNEALRGAKVNPEDIVDIILVGGSCKMPVVQKYLSALFHQNIIAGEDSEYMVGYGTGVLTGIIQREAEVSDIVMTDVCPFSLGIGSHAGGKGGVYMSVIIPKNSILPIAKSKIYSGMEPFQKQMKIVVYQGEELYAQNNLSLGTLMMDMTPDEQGDTEVEVTFCYDIDGVLEVTAKDLKSGNVEETVIVNKNSQLTAEQIEKKRMKIYNEMRIEKNKEENRNILAWAQRLYAQADDECKKSLTLLIADFEESLEANDVIMVQKKKRNIVEKLLKLELMINMDYFGNADIIGELMEEDSSDE